MVGKCNRWKTIFKDKSGNILQERDLKTQPIKQVQLINAEGKRVNYKDSVGFLKKFGYSGRTKEMKGR